MKARNLTFACKWLYTILLIVVCTLLSKDQKRQRIFQSSVLKRESGSKIKRVQELCSVCTLHERDTYSSRYCTTVSKCLGNKWQRALLYVHICLRCAVFDDGATSQQLVGESSVLSKLITAHCQSTENSVQNPDAYFGISVLHTSGFYQSEARDKAPRQKIGPVNLTCGG